MANLTVWSDVSMSMVSGCTACGQHASATPAAHMQEGIVACVFVTVQHVPAWIMTMGLCCCDVVRLTCCADCLPAVYCC